MARMGGNAVRLYVSLVSVLDSPTEANATALGRLRSVVDLAGAHGLLVDLTGANVMRPARVPAWLARATDAELRTSHRTFWTSCAEKIGDAPNLLAFNLVNEPIVPRAPVSALSTGCLGGGPSAFAPGCDDTLCYCDFLRRAPTDNATSPIEFARGWCREMASAIRSAAPAARITLGDLALSMGGAPTCTVADGLTYYSLHLYPSHPPNATTVDQVAAWWRGRINALPNDGAPAVIEEMYPLGGPKGVSFAALMDAYLNATRPRTRGWMSFYWGSSTAMKMAPMPAALYNEWLGVFQRGRPWL